MRRPNLFYEARPLALASASPRRRDFLRGMGINCRVMHPPAIAEPEPFAGEAPEAFAARAAKAKADMAFERLGGEMAVLTADTAVFLGGKIYGKPRDKAEAMAFLRELAGKTHTVRTACHLRCPGESDVSFYGEAQVRMGVWPDAALEAYAASGEGLDKAGGYAAQGMGAFLIESVQGSWSSVVGLPVAETTALLLEKGIIAVRGARANIP